MNNFKLSLSIIICLVAIIYGCEKDKTIHEIFDDPNIKSIEGTWKVVSYDDFTTNAQITKNADNTWTDFHNGDVTIIFIDSVSPGILNGITVTNQVTGNYTLSDQRVIKVENFGGTKINQPDWANWFWDNFTKAEAYKVNNTQLRIFYNTRRNSITFEKQ